MHTKNPVLRTVWRLVLIVLGSALLAFNINTFVRVGSLIPGGFTGVALLAQEVSYRYFEIRIPFSLVFFLLSAGPAIICFRFVGKKFTMYSTLVVILSGLMTDLMPEMFNAFGSRSGYENSMWTNVMLEMFTAFIGLDNYLLAAVFGGVLHAIAVILCLHADATSGGTDFIAIYASEKYNKDTWNHIFVGNCVVLAIAGVLFSLEIALYSIIFQFTMTVVLNSLYRAYQQQTMLIVTSHPVEIYELIREKTNHAATSLHGTGLYDKEERSVLYSVVYANEVRPLIRAMRVIDPNAFINVIKTEQINGKFFRKPKD
ncbi:MAG: YitT family protein [Treponema sp.]|nr:YitT family protein [Treponema sp.]